MSRQNRNYDKEFKLNAVLTPPNLLSQKFEASKPNEIRLAICSGYFGSFFKKDCWIIHEQSHANRPC